MVATVIIWCCSGLSSDAQEPLAPLVDPNFNVDPNFTFDPNNSFDPNGAFNPNNNPSPNSNMPSPFPGGLPQDMAPLEDPSQGFPPENLPPAGSDPNVPDPATADPSVSNPNGMNSQNGPLIPPGTIPIPDSFPQAINESMIGWMDWANWDSSVELGINGSSGNSESFNISSGFDLTRTTEQTETRVDFNYINNKSNDILVAHNARLTIDWEKNFGEELGERFEPSRWSWFIKNTYFYDDFQSFDLRIAINTGFGYKFLEDEIQMLKGRFGAGASREVGGINDEWIPEALFGLDYRRQLSKRQKIDLTIDFFPSWEDFADYRVVSDFSWEFLLDEETNLSLKFNVNDQYDSTPDGNAVANDIFYSLLLLWKF